MSSCLSVNSNLVNEHATLVLQRSALAVLWSGFLLFSDCLCPFLFSVLPCVSWLGITKQSSFGNPGLSVLVAD